MDLNGAAKNMNKAKRLKQVEEVTDEMPREFQIEIIDSLSRYSNDEIDKAIKEWLIRLQFV